MDRDALTAEIDRLSAIVLICNQFGEADGENAATSMCRALQKRLAQMDGQHVED